MKTQLLFLASVLLFHAEALPDPLVAADGMKITTAEEWREKRRPELLEMFAREMYGRSPGRTDKMISEVFDRDEQALAGKATRLQLAIYPDGKPEPRVDLLVYLPNGAQESQFT